MLPAGELLAQGLARRQARGDCRARGREAGIEPWVCRREHTGRRCDGRHKLPFQVHAITRVEMAPCLAAALRHTKIICSYCRGCSVFMAATRSFDPAPHREIDLIAWVKGTSRGCTRSRLRI